jgi:hypothetical protein
MKCSMNSFKSGSSGDPSELKAILFALVPCLLFIGFLTFVHRLSTATPVVKVRVAPPPPPAMPAPPVRISELPPPAVDMNARFRVVPSSFRGINFATRSYGTYQLSDGTNRELVLVDGQYRDFGETQQWFDLNDVVYTDLTGDGRPEAIVMLTHLECGRQCDGGKNLVYIYSHEDGVLSEILKFEGGSGLGGCSLKSLMVRNKVLTLDLFGKCPQPATDTGEYVRRDTYDVTRLEFFFNGRRLGERKRTVVTLPDLHEVNYGVDIHIFDDRTPNQRDL